MYRTWLRLARYVAIPALVLSSSLALAASHTVQSGDTPAEIAKKYGIGVQDLLKANKDLDPRKMKVGQTLTIPGGQGGPDKADDKKSKPDAQKARAEDRKAPEEAPKKADKAEPARAQEPAAATYTVKAGDSPGSIAKKLSVSVDALMKANKDLDPRKMKVGQTLVVPGAKPKATPAAEPETARAPASSKATPTPEAELETIGAPDRGPDDVPAPAAETPKTSPAKEKAVETAAPASPEKLSPGDADAFFEKGIEFGKQNQFEKAIENFDKAIRLNANRADYYASRGHAFYYMKLYTRAIEDYSKAIEKNPSFALAFSMRGLSRTRAGRYQEALGDYNKAIELGPKEADYYKGRGFTYLHLKQYPTMCEDYKKACSLGDCELLESAKKENLCQ